MSIATFAKRWQFWLGDMRTNKGLIYRQYREIRKVNELAGISFADVQLERLKQYAKEHVPFYMNHEAFPVVNKNDYVSKTDDFISDEYNKFIHSKRLGGIHVSSTSGSTGTPLKVYQNREKRARTIADLKAVGEWCGYRSHERMVLLRSHIEHFNRTPEREKRENIFYISCDLQDDDHIAQICSRICTLRPKIVFGYSSTLTAIESFLSRHPDIDVSHFGVRIILVGAEAIDSVVRRRIESRFSVPVFCRYSDMEAGIFAQDMGSGTSYKWNWASFYLEVLKLDSDEPVGDGEVGRIVISDLFNYAMPLIRYDTGDLGVIDLSGDKPGLKEVYGRKVDAIYATDGKMLSPHSKTNALWGIHGIRQWQLVQTGRESFTLNVNLDDSSALEKLVGNIKAVVGQDADIIVNRVDEIPILSSGKRRAVIQKYYV